MLDVAENHEEVIIFHANEAGPSELTTAYLAVQPRNRFVRVSYKITALAYQ